MHYHHQLKEVISNLYHTWNKEHPLPELHGSTFGADWRETNPPVAKQDMDMDPEEKLKIKQNRHELEKYLTREETWFARYCREHDDGNLAILNQHPIAYFGLEFALVDWLQIYSGGLGVLAGDFIKESSDMGVPMVAVGLFYHHGYCVQHFDEHGNQYETYPLQLPEEYPFELVMDSEGNMVEVSVEIVDHEVFVRVWRVDVGNTPVYLLDTNYERNELTADRMITAHLYGGDTDTRLRQEIVLGIGGPRLLKKIGVKPALFHMNEGHSGFLVVEMARHYVEEKGLSFEEAVKLVDDHLLFTNHTLKAAGNDIFTYHEIEKFFGTYLDNLHTSIEQVFALGKDDEYANGNFSMTVLGLRNAKKSNAVSILHEKAAQKTWPNYKLEPITNGVHMPTWVAKEIHELFDNYIGEDWHDVNTDTFIHKIDDIPTHDLWHAHQHHKQLLMDVLNRELSLNLHSDILTVVWARRFASYKRPDMILSDLERLSEIVNAQGRQVQLLVAGKAHPRDGNGKALLKQIWETFHRPEFYGKLVLIPDYNWMMGHYLAAGGDVWLNTPRRYEEASGTSGMKACANGVLQFTTLDGWTDEVDWDHDKIGWEIDQHDPANSLYNRLQNEIVPMYYDKSGTGYSEEWVNRMKRSIKTVLYRYSTSRMMKDYLEKMYLPVVRESGLFG